MRAANIESLSKPASLAPVIRRANEYIAAMKGMGKPVTSITLAAKHYDAILRSVNAGREKNEMIAGLRMGDSVAVLRGSA